jgi:hypothetical protein
VARNADVAAKLLRDAAQYFLAIGEENPNMLVRMKESAEVYEAIRPVIALSGIRSGVSPPGGRSELWIVRHMRVSGWLLQPVCRRWAQAGAGKKAVVRPCR